MPAAGLEAQPLGDAFCPQAALEWPSAAQQSWQATGAPLGRAGCQRWSPEGCAPLASSLLLCCQGLSCRAVLLACSWLRSWGNVPESPPAVSSCWPCSWCSACPAALTAGSAAAFAPLTSPCQLLCPSQCLVPPQGAESSAPLCFPACSLGGLVLPHQSSAPMQGQQVPSAQGTPAAAGRAKCLPPLCFSAMLCTPVPVPAAGGACCQACV